MDMASHVEEVRSLRGGTGRRRRGGLHVCAPVGYTRHQPALTFSLSGAHMAVAADSGRYLPGSLVHVRGRDWIVLPSQETDVLRHRSLTGGEDQVTGVYLPVEGHRVNPASFDPPDLQRVVTPQADCCYVMPPASASEAAQRLSDSWGGSRWFPGFTSMCR